MFDLHRHTEFSTYDGFGRTQDLAIYAKELGYTALGITDHGNTNGLVQHYKACKSAGIKPILGVECYFLPVLEEKHRGYHLVLLAKNLNGYGNLNRIQYEGEKQKYFNAICTFDILEKYSEDIICTTACCSGYLAECIKKKKFKVAEKYLEKMLDIFGDDFYVEVQPYKISDVGVQEYVNVESIKLAKKVGAKIILTSDSHRGEKEDLDSYLIMHYMANHNMDNIEETYGERYMPLPNEMQNRFYKMHKKDFKQKTKSLIIEMCNNLEEIENKCEENYLDNLKLTLPIMENVKNSNKKIKEEIIKGLKKRNKYNKTYLDRCKEEMKVIEYHGFEDYFLIVADYVRWAKKQNIAVGPGRGSVCNCLVAFALEITEVDSLYFDLEFSRFLRYDKKAMPDVDLDFQTSRRDEVIEYVCNKYKGKAARICSYGLYKTDNLVNALAKVCGLPTDKSIDEELIKNNKKIIAQIKKFIDSCILSDVQNRKSGIAIVDKKELLESTTGKQYNKEYNNIIYHFYKLFLKITYIGTHAAGVAIVRDNILDYTAIKIGKDGNEYTNYDLTDLEDINVMKFDMLGLKTMETISELRELTNDIVDYERVVEDEKVIENFSKQNVSGIFQFESSVARKVLEEINCDCFEDVIAGSSMNRPGPLMQKLPKKYAENKINIDKARQMPWYKFSKRSYGTIIYQEQIQKICIKLGKMDWKDIDRVLKLMKTGRSSQIAGLDSDENFKELLSMFQKGAMKNGMSDKDSWQLFYNLTGYTFNCGHGTGYSLVSAEEMYYKCYYPNEFWYTKIKQSKDDLENRYFCENAVHDGSVIFLPHINYSNANTSLREFENENVIQQGLTTIKNVGEKAAIEIQKEREKNGLFEDYDDFVLRCKGRLVNVRVISALKEIGACDTNEKRYYKKVTNYNSTLYARKGLNSFIQKGKKK